MSPPMSDPTPATGEAVAWDTRLRALAWAHARCATDNLTKKEIRTTAEQIALFLDGKPSQIDGYAPNEWDGEFRWYCATPLSPAPPARARGIDLDAIERAAKAATPGPWAVRPQEFDDWGYIRTAERRDNLWPVIATARAGRFVSHDEKERHRENGTDPFGANAAHIAGMDPSTVIALVARVRSAEAARDAALARVRELEAGLRPFAKVAQHWRAVAYMRDDKECLIAWASDVSARLVTSMASQLPRIRFEAFRAAARLLAGKDDADANARAKVLADAHRRERDNG